MAAQRLSFEVEAMLHPEARNNPAGGAAHSKKADDAGFFQPLEERMVEFQRTLDQVETLLATERDAQTRTIMSKRLQGHRQRLLDFRTTLEGQKRRQSRRDYEQNTRAQLFGRNASGGNDGAQVLDMINQHQAGEALGRSSTIAADTISLGVSVLENLQEQGGRLRSAQDKLVDIANVLGLSNSLIRVIDRREKGDAMVVYGGIVATTLLLLLVYYFVL